MNRMSLLFLLAAVCTQASWSQGPCNNQTSVNYDGYDYAVVEIGDQCWYAENSKYLPFVNPVTDLVLSVPYCGVQYYIGDVVEFAKATFEYNEWGVVYNRSAIQELAVCPSGWHVPTTTDWLALEENFEGEEMVIANVGEDSSSGMDILMSETRWAWGGVGGVCGAYCGNSWENGSVRLPYMVDSDLAWVYYFANYSDGPHSGLSFDFWKAGTDDYNFYCEGSCSNVGDESLSGSSYVSSFVRCVRDDSDLGCTNPSSCNYNAFVSQDDGSCIPPDECGVCNGDGSSCADECGVPNGDNSTCLDECGVPNGDNSTCLDACGVPNGPGPIYECGCADIPEGECDCNGTLAPVGYDCNGNCLEDADGDGVCDEFEVLGCTDITACNYSEEATEENSSCILLGDFCNDGDYLTENDFIQADCSCNGFGCNDPGACNYSATALHQSDLCEYESCAGCTDGFACNYTETSTIDDGSCMFVGDSCDDGNPDSYNDQIQSDCSCQGQFIGGCTYWVACNYDPSAIMDDGSCTFVGEPCDDLNPLTFNDFVDEDCMCGDILISGIGELDAQFTVFPNPVSDQLVVAGLNQSVQMDISLFDAAQREVLNTSCIGQTTLDVSSLSPGVYLVSVRTAYGRSHTKVSVQ